MLSSLLKVPCIAYRKGRSGQEDRARSLPALGTHGGSDRYEAKTHRSDLHGRGHVCSNRVPPRFPLEKTPRRL